ncbi:MAG: hypothetical protein ACK40Z_14820, partial [Dietzia sp.]
MRAPGAHRRPRLTRSGTGLDGRVAFEFHKLREERPALFTGRLVNQMWYIGLGIRHGGLCNFDGSTAP